MRGYGYQVGIFLENRSASPFSGDYDNIYASRMEKIDSILAWFRKEYGLEGPLTDDEFKELAHRHIDPDIAAYIKSIWVEGNILYIYCTEPVVVQEIQGRSDGLMRRINRDAGRSALAAVRVTSTKKRAGRKKR